MDVFQLNELKNVLDGEKQDGVAGFKSYQGSGGYQREIVTHYEMDERKSNYAMIFNHEEYDDKFLSPSFKRAGTEVDCKKLIETLEYLSFEVDDFLNLTHLQIVQRLRKVADMDHTQHNCLLIVVMTHGDLGKLYAYDTAYYADTIWPFFTPENCPSLAGKPKLFFIQACQGKKLDAGSILEEKTVTDGSTEIEGSSFNFNSLLTNADFLVFYATIADHRSFRNEYGSWFIRTVCSQLRERATKEDLLTVLTYVNQDVALNFNSNAPEQPEIHEKKQIPCIISRLTKLVQFYTIDDSD